MSATEELERALDQFDTDFRHRFEAAANEHELREIKAGLLGKKGALTEVMKGLGGLPPEGRKSIGARVNGVKQEVESAFESRLRALATAARDADLNARPFDLSLPGRASPRGHRHPISLVQDELVAILGELGFTVAEGPQVELEEYNFTKLAFPPDHPATDMQDTFWVDVAGAPPGARTLLRTHTSPVQVRELLRRPPPVAVVSPGVVFRRDDDVTHAPMFHQVEGILVDRGVSFAELKGVLDTFARRLFGAGTKTRYRPSYFPFVEPGAEVDVSCVFCGGSGCRLCKHTGWIEVLGCGMVHPAVFEACGIDPEVYTGFAFGIGVERVALLRYDVPDIRWLFENDPRFLAQF